MPGFEWFGDEERKEVQDVLNTGYCSGTDLIRHEKVTGRPDIRGRTDKTFGVRLRAPVSSGTSALSIALAACGVGAGDEVIVPPFTFVASVEALLAAGTIPVFAEIDETLCLDHYLFVLPLLLEPAPSCGSHVWRHGAN